MNPAFGGNVTVEGQDKMVARLSERVRFYAALVKIAGMEPGMGETPPTGRGYMNCAQCEEMIEIARVAITL